MFGPEPWTRWYRRHKFLAIACILIIAGGLIFWYLKPNGNGDAATNKAEQHTLQVSLTTALNEANDKQIVSITNRLINGEKQGRFQIDNATLSGYYLVLASSDVNLNNYADAVTAYDTAQKLDSSSQFAALQGELIAKYKLGQRQQLIPLLEQLKAAAKKNNPDQQSGTPAQYQYDIERLQHNQEINL